MCDGRRAFSQQHDYHVLLQMNSTRTTYEPSVLLGNNNIIEVVAGWAAGYEAVKLTPKMIILLSRSGHGETTNDDNENENDCASSSDQRNDGDRGDEL